MTSVAEGPRVAEAVARLRAAGERVTPARYAVLRVVDAADGADEHLTAEQIGGRVAQVEPAVHRATVYRTLTSLTEIGILSHVHLGGSATVYHLSGDLTGDPTSDRTGDLTSARTGDPTGDLTRTHPHEPGHSHVQCHRCGRVLDVAPEVFDEVGQRLLDDLGFVLDTTHAALLGTCRECAAASAD